MLEQAPRLHAFHRPPCAVRSPLEAQNDVASPTMSNTVPTSIKKDVSAVTGEPRKSAMVCTTHCRAVHGQWRCTVSGERDVFASACSYYSSGQCMCQGQLISTEAVTHTYRSSFGC